MGSQKTARKFPARILEPVSCYRARLVPLIMQGSTVEVASHEVALLNLEERRLLDRTPSMGVGAASVEPAPGGRIDGARYLSADHVASLMAGIHGGNRGYERLRGWMQRGINERVRI